MNLKSIANASLRAVLLAVLIAPAHAAFTNTFNGGALSITAVNEAQIVLSCNAGNVAINGNTALTPAVVACASVTNMTINGDALANNIDLSALTVGDFPVMTATALLGGDAIDTISASFTSDVVTGGKGDDAINLGTGSDVNIWNNGDNTDAVIGGDGNDRQIVNGAGVGDVFTVIAGTAPVSVRFDRSNLIPFGIDLTAVETLEINGLVGDDSISAGTLASGLIALQLNGGDGNDTIAGSSGIDVITGGIGNDTIDANPGDDSVDLGTGDDSNVWNNGDNTDAVIGGEGNDRQIVNGAGVGDIFTVNAGTAPVAVRFDRSNLIPFGIDLTTVETLEVHGLVGDDNISAGTLAAGLIALQLNGGDGNDTIAGSSGVDQITGGIGNDTIDANPGDDSIDLGTGDDSNVWNNGDNTDAVIGGDGNDRQIVNGAGVGDIFTVIAGTAPVAVRFDRSNLIPFGIDLTTVETLEVNGLVGDDNISAGTLAAGLIALQLNGGDGNDNIAGSSGIDVITGGIGNDTIDANPGDDSIDLGTGDDSNVWNNGDNTDAVIGGEGNDRQIVNGAGVGDIFTVIAGTAPVSVRFDRSNLIPFGIDLTTVETLEVNGLVGDDNISAVTLPTGLIALELNGGDNNDTLIGSFGLDVLNGGAGEDSLRASANPVGTSERVIGGTGNDQIIWNPGDGDDLNEGSEGNDTLLVNGAGASEQFRVSSIGARFLFVRLQPTVFMLDSAGIEQLQLNATGGDDIVETQPLVGVQQQLDGGPQLTALGDNLRVGGTSAVAQNSPILTPGFGAIAHSNFEFAASSLSGGSFSGSLSGSQEVPPVTTSASGRGTVQLNADETEISVRVSFAGLSSPSTVGHIHGPAPVGTNAPPIFNLTGLGGTAAVLGPTAFAVTAQQVRDLKAGLWYFNIHSQNNPGGEIRGQILLDRVFDGLATGRQVVPQAQTLAQGYATVRLDGAQDQVFVTLSYSGLTGEGVPGASVDVGIFAPARRGIVGSRITSIVLPASGLASDQIALGPFAITPTQAQQLASGLWYVQVASAEFPQGEIRGQITDSVFYDGFE